MSLYRNQLQSEIFEHLWKKLKMLYNSLKYESGYLKKLCVEFKLFWIKKNHVKLGRIKDLSLSNIITLFKGNVFHYNK